MLAPNILSDFIAPLHVTDTGEQALVQMHEHNVSQLPVVDDKKYIGLVTMEDVINMKHLNQPIGNFSDTFRKACVADHAHVFDIMKAAVEFNVRVVPVVDEEQNYLGIISAESCLRAFATLNSVKEAGGILELEKEMSAYSLSEIARIVEECDADVLCLYTNHEKTSDKIQITLKVDTTDLNAVIASFERHNYEIKSVHNETEYTEDLKDRYDALMRYLNV